MRAFLEDFLQIQWRQFNMFTKEGGFHKFLSNLNKSFADTGILQEFIENICKYISLVQRFLSDDFIYIGNKDNE